MKRLLILAPLALLMPLLAACHHEKSDAEIFREKTLCHGVLYLDPEGFSQYDIDDMQIAVVRWNEFLGLDAYELAPEDDTHDRCVIRQGGNGVITSPDANILISRPAVYAFMNESIPLEQHHLFFQYVMLHEIGHTLGLNHTPGFAVMNANFTGALDFTDEDRNQVWQVLGI